MSYIKAKQMKNKNTKYQSLLTWVDSLPANKEFTFLEAKKALAQTEKQVLISQRSCSSVIAPLVIRGLVNCREVNPKRKFFTKAPAWTLEKALEANYQRLCQKWQKYKPN